MSENIDTEKAALALVRAFYLYPHYRVDSRGPSGCIMDALDIIAPAISAQLRDGVDARDVYRTLDPHGDLA